MVAARRAVALFLLAVRAGRDGEPLDLASVERLARIADERLALLAQ